MRFRKLLTRFFSLKRWQHRLLETALILGALRQTRGLSEGVAPWLVGVLTDGTTARVGAGDTATLVAFWAETFPA